MPIAAMLHHTAVSLGPPAEDVLVPMTFPASPPFAPFAANDPDKPEPVAIAGAAVAVVGLLVIRNPCSS